MTEYYEILTGERIPTGRRRCRDEAMEAGEYRSGAEIWVFHRDGRLMVTRRHPMKKGYPGMWECTGGLVRAGETTRAAILREAAEEIGIAFESKDVRPLATLLCGREFLDVYTAVTDRPVESLILQSDEVVDARYVTWEELDGMNRQGLFVPTVYRRLHYYRNML